MTVKGLRLLQQSPVVAFPAGVGGKMGMAEQIAAPWLRPEQTRLALTFPYVQDEAVLTQAWAAGADRVWHYLHQGQDVAFLCEGDISFYSTFSYLAQTLQQQQPTVNIQFVPGVCSPLATASMLGLPLTMRDQRLVVLPALYHANELEQVLTWAEVVVLLKVSSVYEQVWAVLQRHGLLERSYVVERVTWPEQKIHRNLTDWPHLKLPYFSLMVIYRNR